MLNKRISKKVAKDFPAFINIEDARKFLIKTFGDNFNFYKEYKDLDTNEIYHVYRYILDREMYNKMREYGRAHKAKTGKELFFDTPETKGFSDSFQDVFIYEKGKIQVIGG